MTAFLKNMSNLQQAMLFTLPGASLVLMPLGYGIQKACTVKMGMPAGYFDDFFAAGFLLLIPATFLGSCLAIYQCIRRIDDPILPRVLLTFFNMLLLAAATLCAVNFRFLNTYWVGRNV